MILYLREADLKNLSPEFLIWRILMYKNQLDKTLFLLGIMGFLANGDIYSAAPLLVSISNDLQISSGEAALSITSYMLSFGLFTILLGPLGDRFGKTKILLSSSFGTAVFSCLCVFALDINTLILLRFAKGAFAAGIMPVSMALLGDLFGEPKRQYVVAKLMGMMTLGGATATLAGGLLSYLGSWKTVYFSYGIAEITIAFLLLHILDKNSDIKNRSSFFKAYTGTLNDKKLPVYLTIVILTGFSVFGSFTFAGELIRHLTGNDVLSIGIVLSLFGIGGLIGSKIVAKMRLKIGNYICPAAGLIGFLSLLYISFGTYIPILGLAFFGWGISFIFIHSTMIAASQSTRPSLKGTIMSLVSFCMFTGSSIGTIVNKKIIAESVVNNVFLISSIIFSFVCVFAFVILNMHSKQNSKK